MLPPSLRPTAVAVVAFVALSSTLSGCGATPTVVDEPAPVATATPSDLPTFDTASTVGGYAPEFPVDLLGGPEDATVLASSAARRDGLVDVSLNLTTTLGPRKVVKRYTKQLQDVGFEATTGEEASGLAAQVVLTRTSGTTKEPVFESVRVGVLDDGEQRLVTVAGTVVAAPG